jgi:V/A-type H+-transporting ATPase subunit D
MAKVRLTKNELKLQKDHLKRYLRFLPTLELKKQQLLIEIRRIQAAADLLDKQEEEQVNAIRPWVAVFSEEAGLAEMVRVRDIRTSQDNIAGIAIPVLDEVVFDLPDYDLLTTPLWVDRALPELQTAIRRDAAREFAERQQKILREELRVTTQRIKLFEGVKIPEARENIRIIQIFLGDLQTAEVVRGKIAKAKIEEKRMGEVRGVAA